MDKILEYESSSEEEESISKKLNKEVLPLPRPLQNITCKTEEKYLEDPSKHDERIRSFKHVEGNWATFLYIDIGVVFSIALITKYLNENNLKHWKVNEEFHISLSRTFPIPFHSINPMIQGLKEKLKTQEMFEITLDDCVVKCYTNDEETRTFIGIELDEKYLNKLLELTKIVNSVVTLYGCEPYYEESSFHATVLWCVADKFCDKQVNHLKQFITTELESIVQEDHFVIEKIFCKSGNKFFQLPFS